MVPGAAVALLIDGIGPAQLRLLSLKYLSAYVLEQTAGLHVLARLRLGEVVGRILSSRHLPKLYPLGLHHVLDPEVLDFEVPNFPKTNSRSYGLSS